MRETMKYLCENIQGCVLGFQQSDEITLILIDYQTLTTEAWFNYEVQKMCSISASMATMAFNKFFEDEFVEWSLKAFLIDHLGYNTGKISVADIELKEAYIKSLNKGAMFDSRCFNIPKEEVTNLLYWRQVDAARNSVQMAARAKFSHNECDNKNQSQLQEMLFQTYGINWNDYPTHMKRGSCCIKTLYLNEDGQIRSRWKIDMEIPMFKGEGREYVEQLIQPEE